MWEAEHRELGQGGGLRSDPLVLLYGKLAAIYIIGCGSLRGTWHNLLAGSPNPFRPTTPVLPPVPPNSQENYQVVRTSVCTRVLWCSFERLPTVAANGWSSNDNGLLLLDCFTSNNSSSPTFHQRPCIYPSRSTTSGPRN